MDVGLGGLKRREMLLVIGGAQSYSTLQLACFSILIHFITELVCVVYIHYTSRVISFLSIYVPHDATKDV